MIKKISDNMALLVHKSVQGFIKPVYDERVRTYCTLPYPNHPHGCPMYNKRKECPPQAPHFYEYFDITKPFTFIIVSFNLRNHAEVMKLRHPHWTEKQCRNPLYWQNSIRKVLRDTCNELRTEDEDYTLIPEAMGIDVIATAKLIDIDIIFPPKVIVKKVAILGSTLYYNIYLTK